MTEEEKTALGYLPPGLRELAAGVIGRYTQPAAEVRLRLGGDMSITFGRRTAGAGSANALCGVKCTKEDMDFVISRLCGGSLYAHAETIREGVIITAEGLRAGISGRAVVTGGRIECVREISSVNIRIPHRVPGAADELYGLVKEKGSVCIISPPGMGKTTMLRELIPLLSAESRTAVIDTRYELGAGMPVMGLCDFYPGWPRSDGISAAVRTMSPEYIICDEIADCSDSAAVRTAASSGISVIASAHGRSLGDAGANPYIRDLFGGHIFRCVYVIGEDGAEVQDEF